jgi:hypothetical protein
VVVAVGTGVSGVSVGEAVGVGVGVGVSVGEVLGVGVAVVPGSEVDPGVGSGVAAVAATGTAIRAAITRAMPARRNTMGDLHYVGDGSRLRPLPSRT